METAQRTMSVRCCIVGGGPAGVMLGYLLARFGLEVAVLEKHGDFFRDFRGDTVHPSTLQVLDELGLLDRFLQRKHTEVERLAGHVGADTVTMANFAGVPGRSKFICLMPQWEFLNFLAEEGAKYPGFQLLMKTSATGVIQEWGRVTGVHATANGETLDIRADLVVACDGRHSTMRDALGIQPLNIGAPMDVLWFRISRKPEDSNAALGYIGAGSILVCINRDDYWQCAFVIPKGSLEELKARGLEGFRARILELVPQFADRIHEVTSWDDVKLLEVAVNRLEQWYRDGILFIGDAAHAMSPVGGVGINLAIQDAVATANILASDLPKAGPISNDVLRRVQARREWPTKMTQKLQLQIQNRIIARVLALQAPPEHAPWPMKILSKSPLLQRIPARIVGIGFRPEHVSRRLLDHVPA